jgi:hypothetical protein
MLILLHPLCFQVLLDHTLYLMHLLLLLNLDIDHLPLGYQYSKHRMFVRLVLVLVLV